MQDSKWKEKNGRKSLGHQQAGKNEQGRNTGKGKFLDPLELLNFACCLKNKLLDVILNTHQNILKIIVCGRE